MGASISDRMRLFQLDTASNSPQVDLVLAILARPPLNWERVAFSLCQATVLGQPEANHSGTGIYQPEGHHV
jgi:hypothetical protein